MTNGNGDSKIRAHKQMAITGKSPGVPGGGGNFGAPNFHSTFCGIKSRDNGNCDTVLSDSSRGVGHHVGRGGGKLPGQRAPDHGPHHHR